MADTSGQENAAQLIVGGLLLNPAGEILLCQRALTGRQGGKWEFPGGKVEAGESETAALTREFQEELCIRAWPERLLLRIRHHYPETGLLELAFYQMVGFTGTPVNRVFEQIRWVVPSAVPSFDLLEADRRVWPELFAALRVK